MNDTLLTWTERIDRLSVPVRVVGVAVLLVAVTCADLATGPDLTLSFTYALCAMAASWALSRRAGLATAVVAAFAGFLVDALAERTEDWAVLVVNHLLRVSSFLLFAWLIGSMRGSMFELAATARHDPMTGALTKQGFLDELGRVRRTAERSGSPIGVVYFDLDHLKQVNDREGHAAGDALIRRFADRASRHLRTTDPFGRLGGDEFAVVLERAEPDVIELVVGRILADPGLPPVSCGVQVFRGSYPSPSAMLAGADRRMYEDKLLRRGTPRRAP